MKLTPLKIPLLKHLYQCFSKVKKELTTQLKLHANILYIFWYQFKESCPFLDYIKEKIGSNEIRL